MQPALSCWFLESEILQLAWQWREGCKTVILMLLEGYSGVFDKIKALIKFFQNTFTQEFLIDNFHETSFDGKLCPTFWYQIFDRKMSNNFRTKIFVKKTLSNSCSKKIERKLSKRLSLECLTDNFHETLFGSKTITNTLITKPLIEKCQITFEQKFSSKKLRQRDFRKKSNENCQEAFH
jgi:hypothetical protein